MSIKNASEHELRMNAKRKLQNIQINYIHQNELYVVVIVRSDSFSETNLLDIEHRKKANDL